MNNRLTFWRTRRWLISREYFSTFLVLLALMFFGCAGTLKYYEPLRTEIPVNLFDQYEVTVHGYGNGYFLSLSCDVSFLTAVPEGSPLGDIPILIIDSICFVGDCLGGTECRNMLSWTEIIRKYSDQHYAWRYGERLDLDLWLRNGVIIPGGFNIESGTPFKHHCYGPVLSADIKARLLDRRTNEEIGRQTKRVKFEIRNAPAG